MIAELWFYKGPERFFGKLIRWYTKSRYSHVEIVVNGMAYGADAWHGKVEARSVYFFDRRHWDVVMVKTSAQQTWLDQQVGKKYDYLGILGFFAKGINAKKKWYCSELAARFLGIQKNPIDPQELYTIVAGGNYGG